MAQVALLKDAKAAYEKAVGEPFPAPAPAPKIAKKKKGGAAPAPAPAGGGGGDAVAAQAAKVKALKASGKGNKDPEVIAAVAVLKELKSGGGGQAKPAEKKPEPKAKPAAKKAAAPKAAPAAAAGNDITAMTIADVAALLDNLGMKQYVGKFAEFAIDGLTLVECEDADLIECGVDFKPHRAKLLKTVAAKMGAEAAVAAVEAATPKVRFYALFVLLLYCFDTVPCCFCAQNGAFHRSRPRQRSSRARSLSCRRPWRCCRARRRRCAPPVVVAAGRCRRRLARTRRCRP